MITTCLPEEEVESKRQYRIALLLSFFDVEKTKQSLEVLGELTSDLHSTRQMNEREVCCLILQVFMERKGERSFSK